LVHFVATLLGNAEQRLKSCEDCQNKVGRTQMLEQQALVACSYLR